MRTSILWINYTVSLIDHSNWFKKSRKSDNSNLKKFKIFIKCLQNVFKQSREFRSRELLKMKEFGKRNSWRFFMIKFEIFSINTKSFESTLFDLIQTKRRNSVALNDFILKLKTNWNNQKFHQNQLKKNR